MTVFIKNKVKKIIYLFAIGSKLRGNISIKIKKKL